MHLLGDEWHDSASVTHNEYGMIEIRDGGNVIYLYPDEAARLRNALNWMIGPEVPHA